MDYKRRITIMEEYIGQLESKLFGFYGSKCIIINNDKWCANELFSINNKTVRRKTNDKSMATIRGTTVISSGCYCWNIKIKNCSNNSNEFYIGIIPAHDSNINQYECYFTSNGKVMNLKQSGAHDGVKAEQSLNKGDILTIVLDIEKSSVSFLINMVDVMINNDNIGLDKSMKQTSIKCVTCDGYGMAGGGWGNQCEDCHGDGTQKQTQWVSKPYYLGITSCLDENEFELINLNDVILVGYLRNGTNYSNGNQFVIKQIQNYLGDILSIFCKTIYRFGV
eukprot:338633_1